MKLLIKVGLSVAALLLVYGCASKNAVCRLMPPEEMNGPFLRYKDLPGEKVFVCAVDPSGAWTFAYDYDRATTEEAAKTAAERCDVQREKIGVLNKGKLYAVNNEVVYFDFCD
ncbi:MAG: hypothetical protein WC959_09335 [Kiritimatiellales bacterium]